MLLMELSDAYRELCSFSNLKQAAHKAAKGKRSRLSTSEFEFYLADQLISLQEQLKNRCYSPDDYRHFFIHEPKRRLISAASFRDRVLHHALCQIIEPRFEKVFIPHSFANRKGKGTHRAVTCLQDYARQYRYVLRLDIQKHFESIDHDILINALKNKIPENDILELIKRILSSGTNDTEPSIPTFFPGDDLLSVCRPKGLPIGNLTSQFWSNCYLHPLDLFVKRELGCKAYLRYVDDFALFHSDKTQLLRWKFDIIERLQQLRLRIHENRAHVIPTQIGIPWLGFVVFPDYKRIKARKVTHGKRRLYQRYKAWCEGNISFAEFDASVQGWINHVRYADSWQLRKLILKHMPIPGGKKEKKHRYRDAVSEQ